MKGEQNAGRFEISAGLFGKRVVVEKLYANFEIVFFSLVNYDEAVLRLAGALASLKTQGNTVSFNGWRFAHELTTKIEILPPVLDGAGDEMELILNSIYASAVGVSFAPVIESRKLKPGELASLLLSMYELARKMRYNIAEKFLWNGVPCLPNFYIYLELKDEKTIKNITARLGDKVKQSGRGTLVILVDDSSAIKALTELLGRNWFHFKIP